MLPIDVTYDPDVDAAYICLKPSGIGCGEAKRSHVCHGFNGKISLDFDADGHLIGVELLNGDLLHPELHRIARRLGSAENAVD